jgi:hypothetical protein
MLKYKTKKRETEREKRKDATSVKNTSADIKLIYNILDLKIFSICFGLRTQ